VALPRGLDLILLQKEMTKNRVISTARKIISKNNSFDDKIPLLIVEKSKL
jgi:hypothetical protein